MALLLLSRTLPKIIPSCTVINARSLVKPDAVAALYTDLHTCKIDLSFVSKTWLNSKVASSLICPDGYFIGGGGGGKLLSFAETTAKLKAWSSIMILNVYAVKLLLLNPNIM